jgi:hypothetical protein
MRLCLKSAYRQIRHRVSVAALIPVLFVGLSLVLSGGCRKKTAPGAAGGAGSPAAGASSAPGSPETARVGAAGAGPVMIDSIPFGERNGKDEFNASAIVALADSRFLICDNNTTNALFELKLGPDGRKSGPLLRRPLLGLAPGGVDDFEGMTLVEEGGKQYLFLTSSMYVKDVKKKTGAVEMTPSGVLRVSIKPDGSLNAENMPGFRAWLIAAYPQLAAFAQLEPDDGGLNLEGLAWDKSRQALLFGARTPILGGKPLILPVKIKDLAGPWTTANLEALPAVQLTVDPGFSEQGIRDLSNDLERNEFLVITGKSDDLSNAPFALYQWSGNAAGSVRRFNVNFARRMKPEGLTRGKIGGKNALVIVDDNGGFQVIWDDQALPYAGAS